MEEGSGDFFGDRRRNAARMGGSGLEEVRHGFEPEENHALHQLCAASEVSVSRGRGIGGARQTDLYATMRGMSCQPRGTHS